MRQPLGSPSSDEFFRNFITKYGEAWDEYDLETILDYYHLPSFVFKEGHVFANTTPDAKHRYFKDLVGTYEQERIVHADIPHFAEKSLGENSALVTVEWVCKRADGSAGFDFWDPYLLIRVEGQWKILGDTVHDSAVDPA
jgi:hypothetical protein